MKNQPLKPGRRLFPPFNTADTIRRRNPSSTSRTPTKPTLRPLLLMQMITPKNILQRTKSNRRHLILALPPRTSIKKLLKVHNRRIRRANYNNPPFSSFHVRVNHRKDHMTRRRIMLLTKLLETVHLLFRQTNVQLSEFYIFMYATMSRQTLLFRETPVTNHTFINRHFILRHRYALPSSMFARYSRSTI